MYHVVKKRLLATGIALLEVNAPAVAAKVEPGQFVIVRLDELSERIPLTVMDFDREKGTITIVIQDVGYSSAIITGMNEGDEFQDFVGPLGVASEIENYGTVVCIGGGLGIAPVHPIARALKEAGNHVISVLGSRSADLLILEDEMRAASSEVVIATNDGSQGVKGFVTDGLAEVLAQGHQVKAIWAIGPMIMMKAVVDYTRSLGIKTIVSMNPIMVDGTGMCGACRISVGNETKFACVDGPEFDGHLVDFDLAMKRLAFYKDEENRAKARLECNHEGGHH
ncbi:MULTISPECIES: sulfide/dihydroorotate dehydrogenase-like FAD/NAD-binding protein [Desulfosporosinus]|uniref:Sulfide/dihydroorotate dehydrogenase-like FAD/NAD-binding protein n=1 Tax=Desulfosporosinus nitroreducens TaxID=2018668 RepID=A0ABT8QNN9_9FIRM|nr:MULTISPECIES: sulfide/dihydroorotate dehydrogenase-like FAD/NAD-binding protein [Desulfosporosinus]MCB8816498.1 sulfide/dihydroorotate dehydrogenase-like FAD/NAD-binding protein [Desulfosporosinus sp. SRJS8]MCO1600044.1 sulfide/dihydroorotate dehydrogenase-like FAD/NAD-binding protein [Desulfosporosinus nitroreducens]MDA8223207.1 sulfide/dihydroorotate dehydrogenase-like FAD/NAD-binding protein [Desulfitobacterium hafniense]MDO0822926.1 sulfide/dihydroorotate dehydrogenase-like FAD/NAD-bindi